MLLGQRENVLNNWNDNEAIRRREDLELGRFATDLAKSADYVALPIVVQQFGMFAGLHVQRDDFRRKPRGKFQGLFGDGAPAIEGHDNNGRRMAKPGNHGDAATGLHADFMIMPAL